MSAKKGSLLHCSRGPWSPSPHVSMLMLVVRWGCLRPAKKDSIRARSHGYSLGFNIDKRGKGWSSTGRHRFEKGTFFRRHRNPLFVTARGSVVTAIDNKEHAVRACSHSVSLIRLCLLSDRPLHRQAANGGALYQLTDRSDVYRTH